LIAVYERLDTGDLDTPDAIEQPLIFATLAAIARAETGWAGNDEAGRNCA